MTESSSALSSNARYPSPEAYLAELDKFVKAIEVAGQSNDADAQTLQALFAQAETYLQSGHYAVAATAYERLLVVMRHFEKPAQAPSALAAAILPAPEAASAEPASATPAPESEAAGPGDDKPSQAAAAPSEEAKPAAGLKPLPAGANPAPLPPPAANPGSPRITLAANGAPLGAATERRRIVHVERKKIRPYRSPDTGAASPEVDEIRRSSATPGFRLSAAIPTSAPRPSLGRRLLPAMVVVVLAGAALLALFYGNTFLALTGLGGAKTPTQLAAAATRTVAATAITPPGQTASASKAATNVAPTSAIVLPTSTPTAKPTITPSPTVTNTPPPTATPTATSTSTPTPTPTMIFSGPDPLAGATNVLFDEKFDPRTYYWGVSETGFSRSRIANGALEMMAKTPGSIAWLFGGAPEGKDFFELANVTNGACVKDDNFGVVFRAESDSNLLLFGVTCDGRYRLQLRRAGALRLLVIPTPSDAIKTGAGAVNELGVRAEGKQISLYVNRQFLTRVDMDTAGRGRFGVYVSSVGTTGLTATFDDLIAWQIGP